MTPLQSFTPRKDAIVVDCDFDHRGKVAVLLRHASSGACVQLDHASYRLPKNWAEHAARLRWLGEYEALVWPVDSPQGSEPHGGVIGPNGVCLVDLGYPLEVFTDRGLVAWCYSEERNVVGGEIATILTYPDLQTIARFVEPFMRDFRQYPFLEIEAGVLDGSVNLFWQTSYNADFLWCFSVNDQSIVVGPLDCSREEIVAICCSGCSASLLLKRGIGFGLRTYRKLNARLSFLEERNITIDADMHNLLNDALTNQAGRISGYAGNRIGVTTASNAVLIGV
jgi:hypothetical protein